MKTTILKYVWLGLVLVSCGGQKQAVSEEDQSKLEEMVNTKSLYLNARWANPLANQSINAISSAGLLPPGSNPNRIDIIGTASYLEIKKDSVFAILPYYGERQFGNTYNRQEVGIQFKGPPEDLEIRYNEKKKYYSFKFDISNQAGERFNVSGTLFPNFRTNFYINSTERRTIGYWGNVEELKAEE
ncbi:MAG: DUF4251 domain-containing protein [Bacteroidota bacterium]